MSTKAFGALVFLFFGLLFTYVFVFFTIMNGL